VTSRLAGPRRALPILLLFTACNQDLSPTRPFPQPPPGTVPPFVATAPPPRAPEVGWTLLGGREIDGTSDRELFVIVDGPDCEEIRVAVPRGQAEVTFFGVNFADGQRFTPRAPLVFDALRREHVLRIPGGRRQVTQVDFRIRRLTADPLEVAVSGR
jgi:hypothetical protein